MMSLMASCNGVSLDNTCSTGRSLQSFWGVTPPETNIKPPISALEELIEYKRALEHDIRLLPKNHAIRLKKEERLRQINDYIRALTYVKDNQARYLSDVVHEDPKFPVWLHPLLKERKNFFFIQTRPTELHGAVRAIQPVFSLNREDSVDQIGNYIIASQFFSALDRTFVLPLQLSPTPLERLKTAVKSQITLRKSQTITKKLFANIQKTTQDQVLKLFNFDIDFTQKDTQLITQAQIDKAVGGDDKLEVEDYIEMLLGFCAPDLMTTIEFDTPIFNVSNDEIGRDNLIVLIQIFLGEINIHCYANGLSTRNFGQILDSNKNLSYDVATEIKEALAKGGSVEKVLFDLIQNNYRQFGLGAPLKETDFDEIMTAFASHYKTTKDTPYKDEIPILLDKPGSFKLWNGEICVDFANITAHELRELDNPSFKQARNNPLSQYLSPCTTINEMNEHEFESLASECDPFYIANLLLRENIDTRTIAKLKTYDSWPKLEESMRALAKKETGLLLKFYDLCPSDHLITITHQMAACFHAAYALSLKNQRCPNYPDDISFEEILSKFPIHSVVQVASYENNLQIRFNNPQRAALFQEIINTHKNKLYCNQSLIAAFRSEIKRLHGEASTQYRSINVRPEPLATMLEILRIPIQNITPVEGENYILEVSQPQILQQIMNIQRYPKLTHDEKLQKLKNAITKLRSDADSLESPAEKHAALTLITELNEHVTNYDNNRIAYHQFKNRCHQSIKINNRHHGLNALLVNFLHIVNTLWHYASLGCYKGTLFIIPRTASAKQLEQFKQFENGLETDFNETDEPIPQSL